MRSRLVGAAPRVVVRLVALLALASLAGGCAEDAGNALHASLHGTVRDARSGKRLSGVKVEFEADTLESASDSTDDSGSYALNIEAMSKHGRLTATKSGYVASTVSAFLDDADVSIDIALNPQQ